MELQHWYIVELNGELMKPFKRRVDADRYRDECGDLAKVVPVLPMECEGVESISMGQPVSTRVSER